MSNERKGKPSSSSFHRYALCPGAFALEQTVPERKASPEANLGTLVHQYLAGEKVELDAEGTQIADQCVVQYNAVRDFVIGNRYFGIPCKEERFWYRDEWSGAIDRIDFFYDEEGEYALITDYKTGRGEVDPAAENIQLRAYALLVAEVFTNLTAIYATVVQPHAGNPTVTVYRAPEIAQAREEIDKLMAAIKAPDAPRKPSPEACKYCRALAVCPEAAGETKALATRSVSDVPALPDLELSQLLTASTVVEDFIAAIKEEAKARLKAGKEVPGWRLIEKKGATRTDSKALKIRWSELTSEPIPTVTGEPSLMLKKSNQ